MNKLVAESRPPDTFTGGWDGPGDKINHVTLTRNHDDIYFFSSKENSWEEMLKTAQQANGSRFEVSWALRGLFVD